MKTNYILQNVKTFTKKYLTSLEEYKENPNPANLAVVTKNLSLTFSKIDKATKKNVLHKNTAARKKSALTKAFSFVKTAKLISLRISAKFLVSQLIKNKYQQELNTYQKLFRIFMGQQSLCYDVT